MEYREKGMAAGGEEIQDPAAITLSRISPYLIKAVLIGRRKFWSHEGFDYEAIQKAIRERRKGKEIQIGRQHYQPAACEEPVSFTFQKSHKKDQGGSHYVADGAGLVKKANS